MRSRYSAAEPMKQDTSFIKSDAVILRTYEYSETSYIVSLLTRARGTLHALAKGARRAKGTFAGEIDLYAEGQAVLIVRPEVSLHLLTEFCCKERHLPLRQSVDRACAAGYAGEVIGAASPEGESQPELYDLLTQTLQGLEAGDVPAVTAFCQVHLLRLGGYMPDLATCTACGKRVTGPHVAYSFMKSGVLCAGCLQPNEPAARVSRSAISLASSLSRGGAAALSRTRVPRALARETISFLGHVISAAFEQEARMLQPTLAALVR